MPKFSREIAFLSWKDVSEGKIQEDWVSMARTNLNKLDAARHVCVIPVMIQKNRRWKQEKPWSVWAKTPGRCRKKQTLKPTETWFKQSRSKDQHLKLSSDLHMHTMAHMCLCLYTHTPNPENFSSFCLRHFLTKWVVVWMRGFLSFRHLNIWFPVSSCLGED